MVIRFWSKGPEQYRFLSNFHPCSISYEGIEYPSVEHAFQAAKSLDMEERRKVAACKSPTLAKRAGRKVALRDGWHVIKLGILEELLRLKFKDPALAAQLQGTGDAELVENDFWKNRGKKATAPVVDVGGVMGSLLMKIRGEARR